MEGRLMGYLILQKKRIYYCAGRRKKPASSKVLVYSGETSRDISRPGKPEMGRSPTKLLNERLQNIAIKIET
jgi:hypothetical protein